MRSHILLAGGLALAANTFFVGQLQAQDDPAAQAERIRAASGIHGGLVVHVGCGDGRLTAALGGPGFLVHGLARSQTVVDHARTHVKGLGLYGPVSIDCWDGKHLPYADNLVNLLVSAEAGDLDPAEIQRVLAPQGVACLFIDGQWQKSIKPRPANIDEWTHYLHDSTGNPVSQDEAVGPPRRLQWVAGPRWSRHHDHMASMTSLVSTGGRLFYIFDEGPTASIQLPPQWRLIARDAFNGMLLWKRDIASWNTHQWPLKSGPAHLLRRLVAAENRVYVTLAFDAPVSALEAASGQTLMTYEGSERTGEILLSAGTLLALVEPEGSKLSEWRRRDTYVWDNTRRANADWAWAGAPRRIAAYEAQSGRLLWQHEAPVAPCSLAADGRRVIFYDGQKVVCLEQADGKTLWQSEPVAAQMPVHTSTGPRTILYGDVVLFAGNNGLMTGLSASDGHKLWEGRQYPSGHQSLRDLLVSGGLVWTGFIAGNNDSGLFTGRDPLTGEVKNEFLPDVTIDWFHHRCYPSKATEKYLLTSRNGIEVIDPQTQHWETHHWVRGGCIYGILPCNGLVYAPMHSCGCYLEAKLSGFNALAAGPVPQPTAAELAGEARLEKGPAYGHQQEAEVGTEWPMYRRDVARSGSTPVGVGEVLGQKWTTRLGGRLTPPVVAGGRVYLAAIDAHTVQALDGETGEPVWSFTAGGRIDSAPTVHRGLVLFGSADGYVYALRSTDGQLAWRFRAAPLDRRMTAFDQLESAWPAHGSVLVHEGVLYATAGRSMFLDGGIRLVRLEPATGRLLGEVVMDERDPESGENMQVHVKGENMPVALSDILSCDGTHLYMRSQKMDLEGRRLEIPVENVQDQPAEGSHLFCQVGFLDDSWFYRSFWTFGRRVNGGYGGWFQAARMVPAGRILVFDDDRVFGFGRKPEYYVNGSVLEYQLFAADRYVASDAIAHVSKAERQINARSDKKSANASDWKLRRGFPVEDLTAARYQWLVDQPSVQVRAMIAAGEHLIVAGHPDLIDERRAFRLPDDPETQQQIRLQAESLEGRHGGLLWVVNKSDGRPAARYRLASPPVFDGLAAAGGRLFVSTIDGSVACLDANASAALPREDDAPLHVISDEPAEPDYLKPAAVEKNADFTKVTGGRVVAGPLGYRLEASERRLCLAVNKLQTPATGMVTLSTSLVIPGVEGFLRNGFLAFGDGPADTDLVKCGVRLQTKRMSIMQGETKAAGPAGGTDFEAANGETITLKVQVDLARQEVTFTANAAQCTTKLKRPIAAITHIGYVTDSGIADFGPIEVGQ